MALFKLCRGAETNLPTTKTNGYAYFCTDTQNFYIDWMDSSSNLIRSKLAVEYADKLRYTADGTTIEIDPTNILTKNNTVEYTPVDDYNPATKKYVDDSVPDVVTTSKAGLMSSSDKEKLDGIASGAQVNVQADWEQNDSTADDYVKNRTHSYAKDSVPGLRSETFNLLADYQYGDIIKMKAISGTLLKTILPANAVISTDSIYDLMLVINFYDTNANNDSTVTYSLSNYWRNTEYIDEANLACRVIIRNVHCFTLYLIYDIAKLSEENAVKFDATGLYLKYIALSDNITQYCNVSTKCDRYAKLGARYLENVIKTTPQGLTDEQKTQARTNIDAISEQDIYGKLDLSGGTMTGTLTLSADPTNDLDAATKQYVDNSTPDVATTTTDGLMSASDKSKLDGIATGATATSIQIVRW